VDFASRLASTGSKGASRSLSITEPHELSFFRGLSLLALALAGAPVSQLGLGIEDFDPVVVGRGVLVGDHQRLKDGLRQIDGLPALVEPAGGRE
jgi:hypothetical protein